MVILSVIFVGLLLLVTEEERKTLTFSDFYICKKIKQTFQQVYYVKYFCKKADLGVWTIQKPFNLKWLLKSIHELTTRNCQNFFRGIEKTLLAKECVLSNPKKKFQTV